MLTKSLHTNLLERVLAPRDTTRARTFRKRICKGATLNAIREDPSEVHVFVMSCHVMATKRRTESLDALPTRNTEYITTASTIIVL